MTPEFPQPPLDLDAQALVQWAADTFGGDLALACSAGVEDSVLVHLAAQTGRAVRVFLLDTGRLHPETHETYERLRQAYPGLRFQVFAPDGLEIEALVDEQGLFGFRDGLDQRHACCEIRKLRPLERALAGSRAWLTGLRREQSPTRKELHPTESDGGHSERLKIAPLLEWDSPRVWAFVKEHRIPFHPLHDAGYPPSAARPARGPSSPARSCAPAAGGGSSRSTRNAASTAAPPRDAHDPDPHPPRSPGVRGHPHPAGSGRPVPESGPPLQRRQGQPRAAAAGRESLPAGPLPVPACPHRHRPQLPGGARFPRPSRGRAG